MVVRVSSFRPCTCSGADALCPRTPLAPATLLLGAWISSGHASRWDFREHRLPSRARYSLRGLRFLQTLTLSVQVPVSTHRPESLSAPPGALRPAPSPSRCPALSSPRLERASPLPPDSSSGACEPAARTRTTRSPRLTRGVAVAGVPTNLY